MSGSEKPLAPWRLDAIQSVPLRRAEFEQISFGDGIFCVSGWLHAPGETIDSFAFYEGSALAAVVPPLPRPDVRASFPSTVLDDQLGFRAFAHVAGASGPGWFHAHVVDFSGRRPVGRGSTIVIPGFADGLAQPPVHLIRRVANTDSIEVFRASGVRVAGIFSDAILRHEGKAPVRRLLDWGSGCGRVTSFFLKYFRRDEERFVAGCDIDAEAALWCARNLPGGRFVAIGPEPPTPFEDGEFDAICGYSVMTHLDRNRQVAWLRELRRLLRPGGLLIVTAHGETAARYAERPELGRTLAARGIVDEFDDPNLDGVAPAGYYRETYQARAWTEATWGREMEIVEYVEGGMGGFQDLVVLRKR